MKAHAFNFHCEYFAQELPFNFSFKLPFPWKHNRKTDNKADVSAFLFDLVSENVSKNNEDL